MGAKGKLGVDLTVPGRNNNSFQQGIDNAVNMLTNPVSSPPPPPPPPPPNTNTIGASQGSSDSTSGGGGFMDSIQGGIGRVVGGVGTSVGRTLQSAGDGIDMLGGAAQRLDSWMNPHDNGSEADFLKNEQALLSTYSDDFSRQEKFDYEQAASSLESTRPLGLKEQNAFSPLANMTHGAGVAIEGASKLAEVGIREPGESLEFVGDNKGDLLRGAWEHTKDQFTMENARNWSAGVGMGLGFAGMRSRAPSPGGAGRVPTPGNSGPIGSFRQQAANSLNANLPPKVANNPIVKSQIRGRLEPNKVPPSKRQGSNLAESATKLTDSIYEAKTIGGRVGKAVLAKDVLDVSSTDEAAWAVNNFDPEKIAGALGQYNDMADGRSVRRVGMDTLTNPSQLNEFRDIGETAGVDTDALTEAAVAKAAEYGGFDGGDAALALGLGGVGAYQVSKLFGGSDKDSESEGGASGRTQRPQQSQQRQPRRQASALAPLSQPGAAASSGGEQAQSRSQGKPAGLPSGRSVQGLRQGSSDTRYADVRDPYDDRPEEEEDQEPYVVRDPYADPRRQRV